MAPSRLHGGVGASGRLAAIAASEATTRRRRLLIVSSGRVARRLARGQPQPALGGARNGLRRARGMASWGHEEAAAQAAEALGDASLPAPAWTSRRLLQAGHPGGGAAWGDPSEATAAVSWVVGVRCPLSAR